MPLIKANETMDLTSQSRSSEYVEASTVSMVDRARNDANRIIGTALENVQNEVAGIREKARLEGLEAGRAEGYQQGIQEGREKAEQAMSTELKALRQTWFELLDEWQRMEVDRRDECAVQAMQLALAFAERIIHRKVEHDPEIVVDQLRQALDLAQSPSDMEIVVSESDRERVHHALPGLLERIENAGYVSIKTCESMSPGGCLLRMRGGEIDSSLEVQLERLVVAMIPDTGTVDMTRIQIEEEAA